MGVLWLSVQCWFGSMSNSTYEKHFPFYREMYSPSYLHTTNSEAMWILGFCSCVANFDILGYDVTLLECFFLRFWDKVGLSSRVKMYQGNYSWTFWYGIVFQKNNTTGMFFLPSPCFLLLTPCNVFCLLWCLLWK